MTLGELYNDAGTARARRAVYTYIVRYGQQLDSPAPYSLINRVMALELIADCEVE